MKKNVICLALCAMLFALCFPAEAQQPAGKVPRIGFLTTGSAADPRNASAAMHFGRGFAIWATLKGKTSTSSTDMLKGNLNDCRI